MFPDLILYALVESMHRCLTDILVATADCSYLAVVDRTGSSVHYKRNSKRGRDE